MDAVVAVRRLAFRSVELVRRIRHIPVRGFLIRLAGPSTTQRPVGVVERAPHLGEAPMSSFVEPALGLCSPQAVFLVDELFDLIEDGLFVHTSSIV